MNYRKILKSNRSKTKVVIALYFAIYINIGILLDIALFGTSDSLGEEFIKFFSFQTIPVATIAMVGVAIISFLVTIKFYKRLIMSGSQYVRITNDTKTEHKKIFNIVENLALSARIKVPEVYLIEEEYMNAFASGFDENNSMIAITEGLYNKLTRPELEAVIAHELSHIKHEDIKLTLFVGVMTNIMLIVVNFMAYSFSGSNSKSSDKAKMILLVLNFVLPLITIVLEMYLSRKREFMADAGAVQITGSNTNMINALKKISGDYDDNSYNDDNRARRAAYIFNPSSLFSTHPPISERIESLS